MQRKRCCNNFICSRSRILKLLVHTKELRRNYDLFSRFYDGSVKLKNIFYKRLLRQSTRNFNIPSPIPPGIQTFDDWMVQIPAPSGQNIVQMPYPIVGFVCQIPLLKNNRRRLLLSLIINLG